MSTLSRTDDVVRSVPGYRSGVGAVAHRQLLAPLELAYVLLAASLSTATALPELRRTVSMSQTVASLHASMFGWSLLAGGLLSPVLSRFRRRSRLIGSVVSMAAGAAVFSQARGVVMSLGGAALLGIGAAVLVLTVPAAVAEVWPADRMRVFTWLNIPPAIGGLGFPLLLSGGLALGVSWRVPVASVVVLMPIALVLLLRLRPVTRAALDAGDDVSVGFAAVVAGLRRRAFRHRLVLQIVGVTLEFAVGAFSVLYLRDDAGLGQAIAPLGAAAWAIGMIVSRLLTARFISRLGTGVEAACFAVFAGGSALLLVGPFPALRIAGLMIAAVGIAPVYVLGVDRLFAVLPDDALHRSMASSVAGFASGAGISIGPLLVGTIADRTSLTTALVVPIIGALTVSAAAWWHRSSPDSEIGHLGRSEH